MTLFWCRCRRSWWSWRGCWWRRQTRSEITRLWCCRFYSGAFSICFYISIIPHTAYCCCLSTWATTSSTGTICSNLPSMGICWCTYIKHCIPSSPHTRTNTHESAIYITFCCYCFICISNYCFLRLDFSIYLQFWSWHISTNTYISSIIKYSKWTHKATDCGAIFCTKSTWGIFKSGNNRICST